MEIEDNLLALTNAMFRTKAHWQWVSDEQKIKWFFIINRMFSKKFPREAQLLNLKSIDKISAMNLWYRFMLAQPYPSWLWTIFRYKFKLSKHVLKFYFKFFCNKYYILWRMVVHDNLCFDGFTIPTFF